MLVSLYNSYKLWQRSISISVFCLVGWFWLLLFFLMCWSTSYLTWLYLGEVVEVTKLSISAQPSQPQWENKTKQSKPKQYNQTNQPSNQNQRHLVCKTSDQGDSYQPPVGSSSLETNEDSYRFSYNSVLQYFQPLFPCCWEVRNVRCKSLLCAVMCILPFFQDLSSIHFSYLMKHVLCYYLQTLKMKS